MIRHAFQLPVPENPPRPREGTVNRLTTSVQEFQKEFERETSTPSGGFSKYSNVLDRTAKAYGRTWTFANRDRYSPQADQLLALSSRVRDRDGQVAVMHSQILRRKLAEINLWGGDLEAAEAVTNAWEQFLREHRGRPTDYRLSFLRDVHEGKEHPALNVGLLHGYLYWRFDPDKAQQLAHRYGEMLPDDWQRFREKWDWDARVEHVRRVRRFYPAEAFAPLPKKDAP